ncbi:MAG: NUDIX domain-containing protein [Minisyncoccales bacterium]
MEIKNRELHRITSTAIIHKDGKYLIVRRSLNKKAFSGKWTVPGGGLEVDDYINLPKTTNDHWYFAIEKSLKREIKEEVNLEVARLKYLLDIAFIIPDGTPAIILSFYCDYKSGEVKLNEENIDYKWLTYEEAKNYDLIEGILEEMEMVDKILKGANPDELQYHYRNNN